MKDLHFEWNAVKAKPTFENMEFLLKKRNQSFSMNPHA